MLVALGNFNQIIAYFIFVTVLFIALTVTAVFVLRRQPGSPDGYKIPGYPATPLLFLVLTAVLLFLLAAHNPTQAFLGAGVVLLGWPVYHLMFRNVEKEKNS